MKKLHQSIVVIGLTGNIGSGKTQVAHIIEQERIPVISSDRISKELIEHDQDIQSSLRRIIGDDAFTSRGSLNSQAVAQAIFGATPEHGKRRQLVEQLIHHRVIEHVAQLLEELAENGTTLAFIESAIIFETGIEYLFDYVVAVVASEEIRRERVRIRDGGALFTLRQQTQLPESELIERADFVIYNNGTLDELKRATHTFLSIARYLPPRPVSRLNRLRR